MAGDPEPALFIRLYLDEHIWPTTPRLDHFRPIVARRAIAPGI
jgi:hypothetical protein